MTACVKRFPRCMSAPLRIDIDAPQQALMPLLQFAVNGKTGHADKSFIREGAEDRIWSVDKAQANVIYALTGFILIAGTGCLRGGAQAM